MFVKILARPIQRSKHREQSVLVGTKGCNFRGYNFMSSIVRGEKNLSTLFLESNRDELISNKNATAAHSLHLDTIVHFLTCSLIRT